MRKSAPLPLSGKVPGKQLVRIQVPEAGRVAPDSEPIMGSTTQLPSNTPVISGKQAHIPEHYPSEKSAGTLPAKS